MLVQVLNSFYRFFLSTSERQNSRGLFLPCSQVHLLITSCLVSPNNQTALDVTIPDGAHGRPFSPLFLFPLFLIPRSSDHYSWTERLNLLCSEEGPVSEQKSSVTMST